MRGRPYALLFRSTGRILRIALACLTISGERSATFFGETSFDVRGAPFNMGCALHSAKDTTTFCLRRGIIPQRARPCMSHVDYVPLYLWPTTSSANETGLARDRLDRVSRRTAAGRPVLLFPSLLPEYSIVTNSAQLACTCESVEVEKC